MLKPVLYLIPIPCPCGQHHSLPGVDGPPQLMVSPLCQLAGDEKLTELIEFWDGPEHYDRYGIICAQGAVWGLFGGGFGKLALRLQEDKTAEEALTLSTELREAADTIVKLVEADQIPEDQSETEAAIPYIRAVARWYEIVGNLGCGAKVLDYPKK